VNVLGKLFFFLCLTFTWVLVVFHRVVLPPPQPLPTLERGALDEGRWYPKRLYGINQLFVSGSAYTRGVVEGQLTQSLMHDEETQLIGKLNHFFPNPVLRWGLITGLMRWFWGINAYVDPPALEEMYGVSHSASAQFNYLLDPYTRQLAYHGLHEVGQMFVDANQSDKGCTLFAVPVGAGADRSWVIGRNFDFEGGRIFDEEKIVKWVRPDKGLRFVSVIWAGMVGAVTGVNEQGVYVSINAAGSSDFRRFGTPTTLVVMKALQFGSDAEAAVKIIEKETTFITDIFVVADRKKVFRVEKSPRRFATEELTAPTVVTNHLLSPLWHDDPVNETRRRELTTESRWARGNGLLGALGAKPLRTTAEVIPQVLQFLRDKRDSSGNPLSLGNRMAIDALIASHSVIYDANRELLYVGEGPSVSGRFIGFDLKASFEGHGPAHVTNRLAADPEVSEQTYARIKNADLTIDAAQDRLRKRQCSEAEPLLRTAQEQHRENYRYFSVLGDYYACRHQPAEAKQAWKEALLRSPAYRSERKVLEKKMKETSP